MAFMPKSSVFKFKAPKTSITYVQKYMPGVARKTSPPFDLGPTMQQGAEVAVDRFMRNVRSLTTRQGAGSDDGLAVNNVPANNLTRYGLPHSVPHCSNPLCYNNRRTNVVQEMRCICEEVYKNWGPGYTEATYEQAIVNEAYNCKIPLLRQASIDVTNGGCSVHAGRIDLEVDGRYLYELKARDPAMDKDRSQIRKYIRAYAQNGKNISRAFLVFFTEKRGVIFEEITC
jgi:GxxExxY protein